MISSIVWTDIDKLSGKTGLPILAHYVVFGLLKKANLITWVNGPTSNICIATVGNNSVLQDLSAPMPTCAQDIVDYYWTKHGRLKFKNYVWAPLLPKSCDCKLKKGP